jgi:hypothetical protein
MEVQSKELHRISPTAIIHKDGKFLILQRSFNKKFFQVNGLFPAGSWKQTIILICRKLLPTIGILLLMER